MSTINNIGIPEVGPGILQPKLKNRWRVTFTNFGGGGVDAIPVSMQAVNVTRPVLNFDEVQLDRYNSRAWIAGKHNFEPMTLTVEDDIRGGAGKVSQEQLAAQQWLTGAEGPWLAAANSGSIYKFATNLVLLDGNEQVVETWAIEGCWLQNVDYTDLDYTASEAVQITMTIRYDNAKQIITGLSDASHGTATGGASPAL